MVGQKNNVNTQIVSNKYVQEYLVENLGEESVRIIRAANEEITDDALAEKCKLKVSAIRSVLNKLHNMRLAEYTRIKDKETGWYSYFWRVNLSGMNEFLKESMTKEIENTEHEIEEKTTVLSYYCRKCSKENTIDFEVASSISFRCPNCKKSLHEIKNDKDQVQNRLDSLKRKYQKFNEIVEKRRAIELKKLEAVNKEKEKEMAAKMKEDLSKKKNTPAKKTKASSKKKKTPAKPKKSANKKKKN